MHKESQCLTCKHFIDNMKWGCKAFYVIPDIIFFNKIIHNKNIEGQEGDFVYEPKNGKD